MRAMAKKITWRQAGEIIGLCDRQMRRWKERYIEFGYDGLFDHRLGKPSPKRVPVATVGLLLTIASIALIFRTEFWTTASLQAQPLRTRANLPLVLKSVLVALGMVIGFFLGLPPAGVAIVAGVVRPEDTRQQVMDVLLPF